MPKKELENYVLRRLAHLSVAGEENVTKVALEFFVTQVLLERVKKGSASDILGAIRNVFLLRFSSEEVSETINDLQAKGLVIRTEKDKYSLDDQHVEKLRRDNRLIKETEEKIFDDWVKKISDKYPDLLEEEKRILSQDLRLYLNKIFLRHGAECVALIYSKEEISDDLIRRYSQEIEEELKNKKDKLVKIRTTEFPLFLREIDESKKKYFAQILNGTFIYTLIQVDPKTKAFLKNKFENYIFYLDTNVLYLIFYLGGETEEVLRVLKNAQGLGMKLRVSTRTLAEMKRSIEQKADQLLKTPPIKKELARMAADVSEEENLVTAYWRAFAKTGLTKEDFIKRFKYIPELLKATNIEIIDNETYFSDRELEAEKKLLNESIPLKKFEPVAIHDAFHRLLIRQLRAEAKEKDPEKRYWFLTIDSQLKIYDEKTKHEDEDRYVFYPHQLMQILRSFVDRTNDYDATFLELFSGTQIKSADNVFPNDIAERIVVRISKYEDLPIAVASSIMLDTTFLNSIRDEREEVQIQKIDKQIESKLTKQIRELEKRLKKVEEKGRREGVSKKENEDSFKRKNREINRYKFLVVILLFILLVVLNIFLVRQLNLISASTKVSLFILDGALSYGILRIRWKIGLLKSILLLAAIIGILVGLFQLIEFIWPTNV